MLQTAAGAFYLKMMGATSLPNRIYCANHGIRYRSYEGIKRGYYDWQATYNRIDMLDELIQERFSGWVLFLDADAYVRNQAFDLKTYLAQLGPQVCIVAAPGANTGKWDINAGVFLLNLSSERGRGIVHEWRALAFKHATDEHLLSVPEPWGRLPNGDQILNDQTLLHHALLSRQEFLDSLHVETALLNYGHGSFISQIIRQDALPAVERLTLVRQRALEAVKSTPQWRTTNLDYLANAAKTDKGTKEGNSHGYTRYYEFLFEQFRLAKFNALEIGLLRGGPETGSSADRAVSAAPSIQMWLNYFPMAHLYGIDISDFRRFQNDRFTFFKVDLGDFSAVSALARRLPSFKFIIDDASHATYHQLTAFLNLFEHVESGGYYVIEDLDWQPAHIERELPSTRLTRENFIDLIYSRVIDLPAGMQRSCDAGKIADQITDIFIHRKISEESEAGIVKMIVIRKK